MYRQLIGFGLTVGWLWLFFLNGPAFLTSVKGWSGNSEYYFHLFLFCTSITFLATGRWIGHSSLLKKRSLLIISCGLMSVCPGLIYLLPQLEPSFTIRFPWVIYLLIAGGGWGGTIQLFAWLETYLANSVKAFGLSYSGGVVIASLLLFCGAVLNSDAGVIVTMALPLLVLPFILRYSHYKLPAEYRPEVNQRTIGGRTFPVKLIMLIVLFYVPKLFVLLLDPEKTGQ